MTMSKVQRNYCKISGLCLSLRSCGEEFGALSAIMRGGCLQPNSSLQDLADADLSDSMNRFSSTVNHRLTAPGRMYVQVHRTW
jgi:hypothetical protein